MRKILYGCFGIITLAGAIFFNTNRTNFKPTPDYGFSNPLTRSPIPTFTPLSTSTPTATTTVTKTATPTGTATATSTATNTATATPGTKATVVLTALTPAFVSIPGLNASAIVVGSPIGSVPVTNTLTLNVVAGGVSAVSSASATYGLRATN